MFVLVAPVLLYPDGSLHMAFSLLFEIDEVCHRLLPPLTLTASTLDVKQSISNAECGVSNFSEIWHKRNTLRVESQTDILHASGVCEEVQLWVQLLLDFKAKWLHLLYLLFSWNYYWHYHSYNFFIRNRWYWLIVINSGKNVFTN